VRHLPLLATMLLAACTSATPSPTTAPAKPAEASPAASPVAIASPAIPKPAAEALPGPSPSPSPAAGPAAPSTSQDRVGFPEGYQTSYKQLFAFDRPDNKQVRVIYGNDRASAAQPGQPFPYGSILVMETYRARADAAGNPELDANGRYQQDQLAGIFVMRKEPGFGAEYQLQRSGEWEYQTFRPDKSYALPQGAPPGSLPNTNACAACHQDAGAARDWVFRTDLMFFNESGALPEPNPALAQAGRVVMESYLFLPSTIRVKAGTTVTFANDDEAVHTVTFSDGFDTKRMGLGMTVSRTFDTPGAYDYVCAIHPASMKGQITVE
jgi:plastocyanin